jgi:hypothetical protein
MAMGKPRLPLGGVSSRDVELRLPVAPPAPLHMLPPAREPPTCSSNSVLPSETAHTPRDIAPTLRFPHCPPPASHRQRRRCTWTVWSGSLPATIADDLRMLDRGSLRIDS